MALSSKARANRRRLPAAPQTKSLNVNRPRRGPSRAKDLRVKGSRVGDDLVAAFEEMAKHLRGEIQLQAHELPGGAMTPAQIKAIRFEKKRRHRRRSSSDCSGFQPAPDRVTIAVFVFAPRRFASNLILSHSPRISACFFARLQPLICRSTAMASVIRWKRTDQTRRIGRRVNVYPRSAPVSCSAMRFYGLSPVALPT